jgi:hypothetical protein
MNDRTFQPAGAAIAALVAGLAPSAHAPSAHAPGAPVQEKSARAALRQAAAAMKAVAPFSTAQPKLPFDE